MVTTGVLTFGRRTFASLCRWLQVVVTWRRAAVLCWRWLACEARTRASTSVASSTQRPAKSLHKGCSSSSKPVCVCRAAQRWQCVTLLTRDPRDPWPVTHDYSRVMTPDYCRFQSGPLSWSALKIKHHHCHKILRRNNWIKLALWLKLCRKSLQCLKKNEIMGQRVTSTDPWPTQICWPTWPVTRDPLTHCHLWCCGASSSLYGTKVCRYNWHSAGSTGWPFAVLKCKYIFQIKCTTTNTTTSV